jgi:1-deoxy-D-xylulose-5-phosphate reductoisomerase
MKTIALLGSTGSIGVRTLALVAQFPERFQAVALAAGSNLELLACQVAAFHPELVSVATPELARTLAADPRMRGTEIVWGADGALAVASHGKADVVVSAIVGAAGLRPTLAAVLAGKQVALANKEALVVGGELITAAARQRGVSLMPVDSEHSALFQCLRCLDGRPRGELRRVIITASGGPFFKLPADKLRDVTVAQALRHPTWKMGSKITVDSATLMNKGLEVIEARWLFDLSPAQVDILVHPQSIVHALVELVDGSIIAHLAVADMGIPIAYALSFPERLGLAQPGPLSLAECGQLSFERPDFERFPCPRLAYEALKAGGTMPACLNAANEESVQGFLAGAARFVDIPVLVEKVMERHVNRPARALEDLLEVDGWARRATREAIERAPAVISTAGARAALAGDRHA